MAKRVEGKKWNMAPSDLYPGQLPGRTVRMCCGRHLRVVSGEGGEDEGGEEGGEGETGGGNANGTCVGFVAERPTVVTAMKSVWSMGIVVMTCAQSARTCLSVKAFGRKRRRGRR